MLGFCKRAYSVPVLWMTHTGWEYVLKKIGMMGWERLPTNPSASVSSMLAVRLRIELITSDNSDRCDAEIASYLLVLLVNSSTMKWWAKFSTQSQPDPAFQIIRVSCKDVILQSIIPTYHCFIILGRSGIWKVSSLWLDVGLQETDTIAHYQG